MHLLIFEGIATSGKSTVVKKLTESLSKDNSIIVADEEASHVPIMERREELHIDFFENLVKRLVSSDPDVVLIDRFYMTQAFRVKCGLDKYEVLEKFLLRYSPITVFLEVDEGTILERIQKAIKHRNPEWGEYAKSRDEKGKYEDYYINQQRSQLALLQESLIPFKIFNTTSHDYEAVVHGLVNIIQNKHKDYGSGEWA